MTHRLLPLLALVAAVPGAAQGPAPDAQPRVAPVAHWTQLSIRERIVIRIPRVRRDPELGDPAFPGDAPLRWVERKGSRCVPAEDIVGAMVPAAGRVDLMLADGGRTRALLAADCPALDYYFGFYIKPTSDGHVCAGRDAIRSRSGAVCPIQAFRRLVPKR